MTWEVSTKKPKHKCDPLPEITFSFPVGTEIKCSGCKKRYEVVMLSEHGESWKQWRRVT